MSQTRHDIVVQFSQLGLDQVNGSMKTFASTSGVATKSQDALGGALGKTQGSAIKLRTDIDKSEKSTTRANTTTNKYTNTQNKAASSTQSFAEKFRGNRGLIFSVTGIITAGVEAIGMFQNFQNALAKQQAAQDRLNQLEQEGITTGREYTQAQRDLDDANRSVTFALRIMALSMGDLIPFSLLLVNQFVNMKNASAAAKATQDALTASTNALNTSTQATAGGGLTQMVTRAGQVTTGMGTMGTGVRGATTATEELYTSSGRLVTGFGPLGTSITRNTEFIGTRNSGLVGGMNALNLGMVDTQKQSGRFTDVFRRIGDGIRALPAHFTKAGSSIKNFFTHFGTNMGKLPGLFKAAGTAVMGFSRTLLTAFLSNPILGIITAIGVAVSALIFDFGGFRTAINKAGVAVGNAIPPLKGLLEGIGAVMNGAFDAVAGFFGFETAMDDAAEAAKRLKFETDPLIINMKNMMDVGEDVGTGLENLSRQYEIIRDAIAKTTEKQEVWGSRTKIGYDQVITAFEPLHTKVIRAYPEMSEAGEKFRKTIDFIKNSTADQKIKQEQMNRALEIYDRTVGLATQKDIEREAQIQSLSAQIDNAIMKNDGQSESYRRLVAAERERAKSSDKASASLTAAEKIVDSFVAKQGIMLDGNQKLADHFVKHAGFIAAWGENVVLADNNTIDFVASNQKLLDATRELGEQASATWNHMRQEIARIGPEGLLLVDKDIQGLIEAHPELGKQVKALYEHWKDEIDNVSSGLSKLIDEAQEQGDTVVDVEQKIMEAEKKRRESIQLKAAELGIYNKIQDLTLETQENAIRLEEEHNKSMSKNRQTLEALAVARGLEYEDLKKNSAELLKYIMNNDLAEITIGDVASALAVLKDSRDQEAKSAEIERQAAELYVKTLDLGIDTTGLSGKAILALADARLEERDAAQIATDDVALWEAQLQRNQAVEEATIQRLLRFAEVHGITIPDDVERSSDAIKDFIEEDIYGLGEAAEETADDVVNAFEEMRSGIEGFTDSVVDDLEKALSEGFDEFEDMLDDLGYSLDSLAAKQTIINVSLNSEEAEDDILSLREFIGHTILATEGDLKDVDFRSAAAQWRYDIEDEMDDVPEDMREIWDQVLLFADMYGGDTGTDYAAALIAASAALTGKIPGEISQLLGKEVPEQTIAELQSKANDFFNAGQTSIGEPIAQGSAAGIQSGQQYVFDEAGNLVAVAVDALEQGSDQAPGAMESLVTKYLGAAKAKEPAVQSAGLELGDSVLAGADQAAENAAGPMENLVNKYLAPARTSTEPTEVGMEMGLNTTGGVTAGIQQGEPQTAEQMKATILVVLGEISNAIINYSDNAIPMLMTYMGDKFALFEPEGQKLVLQFNNMFANISTALTNFVDTTLATFVSNVGTKLTEVGKAFDTLNSSTASALDNMKSNVTAFASNAVIDLTRTSQAATDMQSDIKIASNGVVIAVGAMDSKISSFASAAVTNFNKVGSAASSAATKVGQLQKAIDALKDKTVTITVKYNVQSKPSGLQHGGSFIADEPTKISGVNVAETFPEIVNVIPLDPKEPNSPFHNINVNVPKLPSLDGIMSAPSATQGGGSNVTVTGNLIATIQLPNGEAMAKVVKPYMLKGYSGIVS